MEDIEAEINRPVSLRELNYAVIEAEDGANALQILEAYPNIRLLFTDVGLPRGMNGRQLPEAALRLRPDLRVLFTIGYARKYHCPSCSVTSTGWSTRTIVSHCMVPCR